MTWLSNNLEQFKVSAHDYFSQYFANVEVTSSIVTGKDRENHLHRDSASVPDDERDIQVDVEAHGATFIYFGADVENKSCEDFENELFGDLLMGKANEVFRKHAYTIGIEISLAGSSILNKLNILVERSIEQDEKFSDYYSEETAILDIEKIIRTAQNMYKSSHRGNICKGGLRGGLDETDEPENKSFSNLNLKITRPSFSKSEKAHAAEK